MTLKKIEFDLQLYKIRLHFQNGRDPLIIHFDTPSRKFYFALMALIVHEMKDKKNSEYVYIRKHEQVLKSLDKSLAGNYASKTIDGMWEKIRKAWHYSLPNLEEAAHFKIEGRDQVPPYEKGGKYLYACSEDECDTWASLFGIDEITNKWRFKVAIDAIGLNQNDLTLQFNELRENDAWQAFLKHLAETSTTNFPDTDNEPIQSPDSPYQKRWPLFIATTMAAILLILGGTAILNRYLRPAPTTIQETQTKMPSIAVLPFVNVSDDPDKEYFCDGITEELINSLARVKDLRVISRTSAFYFKDKGFDLRTIGEKLNVDYILEGSIRESGNQLRISAQLIKVSNDSHLWAETYDREMKDIFDTQEKLAQEIACSLKTQLGCKEDEIVAKQYTENVEAYNLYLKGRYLWNKKSHKEAIAYYEQALKLDPNYALAYAGLADAYNRLAFWFSDSVEEYKSKATSAAVKALEIDNSLSEAHTSLGMMKLHFEYDWKGAESAFKRAIFLNPDNATAHIYYGHFLRAFGQVGTAVSEMEKALKLDPFSQNANVFYGLMLYASGQTEESIKHFRKVFELFPDSPEALMLLGKTLSESGQHEEGVKLSKRAVNITKRKSPFPIAFLGYSLGFIGKEEEAKALIKEALDSRKNGHFSPSLIALMYIGIDNREKALDWLETAVDERDPVNFSLRTVPMYKTLHTDPRWAELMKKMGFEEQPELDNYSTKRAGTLKQRAKSDPVEKNNPHV
jgi:adenylate cyclase